MQSWELYFEYAEQFGLDPQAVNPKTLNALTWKRWLALRTARASRRAYAKASQIENWATELSKSELALMDWAKDNGK